MKGFRRNVRLNFQIKRILSSMKLLHKFVLLSVLYYIFQFLSSRSSKVYSAKYQFSKIKQNIPEGYSSLYISYVEIKLTNSWLKRKKGPTDKQLYTKNNTEN